MKKKLLFVLFAVLTLAVGATAATSSVIERTGKSIKKERTAPARQVAKADADKSPTVYGWLRYVEHAPSDQQYGVCRFNAGDPSTVDVLFPFDAEHQACAGAAANGVYYVYRYTPGDYAAPVDFGTVNLTTGAFTKIADYSRLNALFADMTFDYSTQTMYALANVGSSTVSTLVTVNLTNGDVQNVATLAEKFVALACSYDGQLYAIKGDDGYLYKINKTNGDLKSIGYTYEEPAEYFQSMEFDHSTETLYWAANTIYEEGFLTVVNIANGNSERTGTISENAQVVGLHIPFVRTADKAPAAIEGLTVTPAAEGALSATLSWTNPTQTYDKKGNTTITRVDIFRDNSLAGSVTDAAPGAQSSWTDANVPTSGRHEYKVFAVNADGNGEPAEQTAYIGHDTPVAPTGATVSKIDDTTLKVEWTAPTAGQNGGWIDQASLRYRVKRLTDGSMVAENLTATSCTDTVDKLDTYSYEIEAYTADGNGGKAKTNGVAAGPAITVPYTCSFKTDGDFGLWTVIDANEDHYTWARETTLAAAKYYANEDYETSADDWLISSPIALNAGVQYRLRFNAKSYDESYPEHVAVYLGQGKTVEAMTTKLGDFEVATYDMQQYEVTFPAIAADGNYNIGFYCHSQAPDGYILYVTDVELTAVTNGVLKGTVTDGTNPIGNAVVYIESLKISSITEADGSFDFGEIEAGEYDILIEADGYASKTIKVNIEAGKTTILPVEIQKLRNVDISGLGIAEATDEYPFAERENCFSDDYKTGVFTYVEEHNINRPLMIRATGVAVADAGLPQVAAPKYEVYRLADTDADDQTKWTKLSDAPLAERTLADAQWAALPYGGYRYAVKAVYGDNDASDARLSAVEYCNMTLPLNVAVSTSTPTNEADGAAVALKGQTFGNEYTGTVGADGKLSLGEIWRDVYKVTVSKPGFTTFAAEHDATKGETATVNAVLDEYRVDPFGLEVSKTSTAGQRKFVWNTPNYLFDDFEGHEAFAVNSPGTIGWTYIDDSHTATIPIDGVNYPNAGAEMAFQVFNPYETDPVLGVINEGIRPHSGKQFLASFAKENSSVYNNDFIISPELSFAKDFTFKFFAKSFNEDYGREKMNAGYSTTGKAADNFTWLNGENPVELPMGEWTEYRYTVPAEAKYVAINCVSDYLLFMMVDDVFVGYELPDGVDPDNIRGDLKFEVYLDGNKVAEQAERSFTFDKLQNGTHRAGVKALFHTEASPLVETEFVVTDGSAVSVVANGSNRVYPNPTTGILNIDGAYDRVDVLNVAGAVVARFGNDSTIDIAGNPEGVYIVRVVSGENVTTTKVILKK